MIIDLYAGPRGWSEGLRVLGLTDLGFELDRWACATAAAAGHRTIRADVTTWPLAPLAGRVEGVIASPPCQAFSLAGNGEGRRFLGELRADIDRGDYGNGYPEGVRHVLEVGRWVEALRPRWVAAEQVPPVLPLWRAYARRFRQLGYSAWAGVLNAADFGVPQTRRRAILVASLDRVMVPPAATHARGGAATLFGELRPWVSMAEALGRAGEDTPARTLCGDRSPRWMYPDSDGTHGRMVGFPRRADHGEEIDGYRRRDFRTEDEPAATVTARARSAIVLQAGAQANATVRDLDEPAPTVLASWDNGDTQWVIRTNQNTDRAAGGRYEREVDRPSPTLTTNGRLWAWDRPATTIAGDSRCWPPGHEVNADDRRRFPDADERYGDRAGTNAVRLTITDALILQSFRPDYPVQGTKTKQFEQVGNACPPRLSAHILSAVTGLPLPEDF